MEAGSSIVGSTDHKVSEFPVTARKLCHNSPHSNDSADPVPIRGLPPRAHSTPKFPAATGAARRREKGRVGLAALVSRPPSLGGSRQPSARARFSRREEKGGEGLTAMMSRSHQGRTSLPRKMEPTESINLPTCPSIPRLSLLFPTLFGEFSEGWFDPREGGVCFIRGFRRARA